VPMQSVISKREVPKDLQGIEGIRSGFVIPDVQQTRLVIAGQPGAGKSTFLNSNPQLISLDPERGGDTVADPKALRFTPPDNTAPAELDRAYIAFVDKLIERRRRGATDIQMICIDTIDEMISLFQKALCLRENTDDVGDIGGGHGKGYFIVRDAIFGMLDRAYRAGFGWAIIAHTAVKTVTVGKEERQVSGLAMSSSYMRSVFQKCEHMMFVEHGIQVVTGSSEVKIVNGKRIEKPGKTTTVPVRKLKTRPGGLWQGGDTNDVKVRIPLPSELILPPLRGWDLFVEVYNEASRALIDRTK